MGHKAKMPINCPHQGIILIYMEKRKMKKIDPSKSDIKNLRVEISMATLARLLKAGQVCAADFQCLDHKSKQGLWRLCLDNCS